MAWCLTALLQKDGYGYWEGLLTGDLSDTLEDEKWRSLPVLHTHTWVHKPGPERVLDTCGRIILMGEWGVSTKTGFVMRPELCGTLISCPPPWSSSVSSAYMNTHYFFPPTHTSSVLSCLSELCFVLMLLASFCWGLITAVLSEKFPTRLRDHFC